MGRVPFFAWSALVASIGLLLVLPVLLAVLIYLFVDHRYARALFGGNDGVGSWIGFALTQPVTYLFALPAVGIVAELVPVTLRKRMPMRGVVYGGLALIGVAALSGVTQQIDHDLPWDGSGLDLDGFDDKVSDLMPVRPVHPAAAARAGDRAARRCHRRSPTERPRDVGAAEDHGGRSCSPSSASG